MFSIENSNKINDNEYSLNIKNVIYHDLIMLLQFYVPTVISKIVLNYYTLDQFQSNYKCNISIINDIQKRVIIKLNNFEFEINDDANFRFLVNEKNFIKTYVIERAIQQSRFNFLKLETNFVYGSNFSMNNLLCNQDHSITSLMYLVHKKQIFMYEPGFDKLLIDHDASFDCESKVLLYSPQYNSDWVYYKVGAIQIIDLDCTFFVHIMSFFKYIHNNFNIPHKFIKYPIR